MDIINSSTAPNLIPLTQRTPKDNIWKMIEFIVSGCIIFVLRSEATFWALIALEIINLSVLNWVSLYTNPAVFVIVITIQVIESVLLLILFLLNLRDWQSKSSLAW